jgi:hypothetical protein
VLRDFLESATLEFLKVSVARRLASPGFEFIIAFEENFYSLAIVRDLFGRDSFGLESRKASWYLRSVRARRQQVRAKGQAHC